MTSKSKVYFFFDNISIPLPARTALKREIEGIFKDENRRLSALSFIFCADKTILKINREYLQHDYYTDILTFDLSENGEEIIADIYISADRVRENAKSNQLSFKNEIHRVIFHGALHLCGYNDKSKSEKVTMRAKEEQYLQKYFGRVPRDTVSG